MWCCDLYLHSWQWHIFCCINTVPQKTTNQCLIYILIPPDQRQEIMQSSLALTLSCLFVTRGGLVGCGHNLWVCNHWFAAFLLLLKFHISRSGSTPERGRFCLSVKPRTRVDIRPPPPPPPSIHNIHPLQSPTIPHLCVYLCGHNNIHRKDGHSHSAFCRLIKLYIQTGSGGGGGFRAQYTIHHR